MIEAQFIVQAVRQARLKFRSLDVEPPVFKFSAKQGWSMCKLFAEYQRVPLSVDPAMIYRRGTCDLLGEKIEWEVDLSLPGIT